MEDQRTSKMIFLRSGSSGFFFRSVALSERSFERRAIKITLSLPPLPLQAGFIEIPEELSGRYLSAPSSAADRFNRYFFPRVEDNRSARIIRDKRGPLSAYKRDSYEIAEQAGPEGGQRQQRSPEKMAGGASILFPFSTPSSPLIPFRRGN